MTVSIAWVHVLFVTRKITAEYQTFVGVFQCVLEYVTPRLKALRIILLTQ